VRYTVRDTQVLHSQAVREAALKAKANAEALAAALNLKILRTLTVEETGEPGAPDVSLGDLREAAAPAPAPVQSGSFVVTANVQLTVEVAAR
jgi:uncharacterized protein YggE